MFEACDEIDEETYAFCVRPFGHEGPHQSRVCDGTCDTCDCVDWPEVGDGQTAQRDSEKALREGHKDG